ncbi:MULTISPECIES: hypothetical protein [Enterobacter]|uniref:hypothetical protein n=1 Tax=Enterobacter TaxID=547 RepID=UPI000FEC0D9A|nr:MULTISPECIES: hypothetical protein [Enterobacter]MCR1302540.1 hypothetical protein [Enterobacter sp. FL1277]MCR1307256.1 hypothetical protein [Enterobacter sp. BT1271]MCR1311716.1 hypothetical protein [Enterobacter sp. BT855]MCR1321683.1 hypothetical protein [Enterobacter sp. BT1268]MCR1326939.1 hypothetical protein [Enterobacter sp. BT1131]
MFTKNDYDKKIKKIVERNKGKCYFPGCKNINIFSHVISKSISMSVIAKDNHVLKFSPSRFKDEKIPKFLPAGINETPAFNGFCKEHDNIFKQIDDHEIENLFGVYLQIYRTITSEIHSLGIGSVLYPDLDIDTAIAKIAADTRCELEEKNEIIDEEKFQIALTKIKETLVKKTLRKIKN